jgi:hypothetical protein
VTRGIYLFGPSGRVDEDHGAGGVRTVTTTAVSDATYRANVQFYGDAIGYSLEVELTE